MDNLYSLRLYDLELMRFSLSASSEPEPSRKPFESDRAAFGTPYTHAVGDTD